MITITGLIGTAQALDASLGRIFDMTGVGRYFKFFFSCIDIIYILYS